jgi:hypothetical protein
LRKGIEHNFCGLALRRGEAMRIHKGGERLRTLRGDIEDTEEKQCGR